MLTIVIFLLSVAFQVSASAGVPKDDSWLPCRFLLIDNENLRPSKKNWAKRVADHCPVTDQGDQRSCWMHTDIGVLNILLQKAQVLKKDEQLSADFYYYAWRHSNAHKEGYTGVGGLIRKYGVITDAQFNAANRPHDPLRLSASSKASTAELGRFKFLYANEFQQRLSVEWIDRKRVNEGSLRRIFSGIREQLDHGVPIHGIFDINFRWIKEHHGFDPDGFAYNSFLNPKGYNDFRIPHAAVGLPDEPLWADSHSIQIVGYALGENGEVSHLLLKNSWGLEFGENGYFTADLDFIRSYMGGVYLLQWDRLGIGSSIPKW